MFKEFDRNARYLKSYRVLFFGSELISGWSWECSLVIQRGDTLEFMLSGYDELGKRSVGSTLFSIVLAISKYENNYDTYDRLFDRPRFDGSMDTMANMVADIVSLFDAIKRVIGASWETN